MSKNRKSREDYKKEDILQAVVIADSFNVRFAPITQSKPRTLLPLVNVPLLDYTLECLYTSGIQEVIVFCCIHADQIKEYINTSKWGGPNSAMDVLVVVSEGCMSVGDALRDIDAKSLISNDFVLVNGDMVSNVNLKPLLESHKQRRLKEKTPIMTMVFKKAPPNHSTRCKEEDVVMAIEKGKDRILSYQKVAAQRTFEFPLELFEGRTDICLRFDLLDTHISLCSPQVPQLFTDEFDYLSRDDFVKGILVNEEITGNTIHIHILEEEYAARVSNLHMYDSISKDVLSRWSYPMVPDKNITERREDQYSLRRHNIYLHKDVTLARIFYYPNKFSLPQYGRIIEVLLYLHRDVTEARGCILEENVTIGRDSTVGGNTKISHSVIGKNVTIGKNVEICGAYIWDGCVVGDNCVLSTCVLDAGVQIRDRVSISSGCVIAKKVVLGPGLVLPSCTYLMSTPSEEDGFEEEEEPQQLETVDISLVGEEGHGYKYEQNAESDEEEVSLADLWGQRVESESDVMTESSVYEDTEEEDVDLEEGEDGREWQDKEEDDSMLFFSEVLGVLERGLTENIGADNLILEINSAKSAYGIYIKEVNILLTKAIVELPLKMHKDLSGTQYCTHLVKNLECLKPLLKNYIRSAESQTDCLSSIEDVCNNSPLVLKSLAKLLHYLYNNLEILSEDVILAWYKAPPSVGLGNKRPVQQDAQVSKFIQWLEEAEEESDDES